MGGPGRSAGALPCAFAGVCFASLLACFSLPPSHSFATFTAPTLQYFNWLRVNLIRYMGRWNRFKRSSALIEVFHEEYLFLFFHQNILRKRQQMRSLFLKKHSGRVTGKEEKREWNGFLNCLSEIQLHLMQSTDGFTNTGSK